MLSIFHLTLLTLCIFCILQRFHGSLGNLSQPSPPPSRLRSSQHHRESRNSCQHTRSRPSYRLPRRHRPSRSDLLESLRISDARDSNHSTNPPFRCCNIRRHLQSTRSRTGTLDRREATEGVPRIRKVVANHVRFLRDRCVHSRSCKSLAICTLSAPRKLMRKLCSCLRSSLFFTSRSFERH